MQGKNSVIHRKAQAAREEFDARGMSTVKALRVALARVADRCYGLPLVVTTVEQVTISQANLQDAVADGGLLALLDGGNRRLGALCLDTQFVMALIEVQTTGEVKTTPAAARPVTRTDAAICAPFIDRLFESARSQLEESSPKIEMETYRFGDMVEDARTLALALDNPDYEVFRLAVDLGEGAKTGLMTVIIPNARHTERERDKGGLAQSSTEATGLGDVIRNAPVTLNAVLDRLEMPLKDACKLEVGMCFPISQGALADAQLTSTGGHVAARVMLGQVNGFRAVRLISGRSGPLLQDGRAEESGSRIDSRPSRDLSEPQAGSHSSLHPSDHVGAKPLEARANREESLNGQLDSRHAGAESGLAEV